ncbi:oocyte zinc finger protein XlCOF6-like protein [Leptotrombidium deliense]|uniref:Oocyte zinc finger protein XlCOF6-like protein n=1 Tax=Leptotrombidium deliense TaxID=299467 RepID=A0A443SCP7_9ACAR|nr:oocyte zinc finger protein XlCOF6-like protein [Leptotrombidium deliense]
MNGVLRNANCKFQIELTLEQIGETIEFVQQFSTETVLEQCFAFIDSKAMEFIEMAAIFSDLPFNVIMKIISRETFRVEEWRKCKVLIEWQQKHTSVNIDHILESLCWDKISTHDYWTHIRSFNVVSNDKYFQWVSRDTASKTTEPLIEAKNDVSMNDSDVEDQSKFSQSLSNIQLESGPFSDVDFVAEFEIKSEEAVQCSTPENNRRISWYSSETISKVKINNENGVRSFECKVCKKMFLESVLCHKHVAIVHNKPKNFSCRVCDKQFESDVIMQAHVEEMHSDGCFLCDFCGKVLISKYELLIHKRSTHQSGDTQSISSEELD